METVDAVVVGAGVIGLAVARALAMAGQGVVVIERERQFGTSTSSRNSEVIHAGIYYPPGSLKARLCVEGRNRLYAHCRARGVPYRRCGKLILAGNESQKLQLDSLAATATANGVDDIRFLKRREAQALEPEVECVAALLSPSTGIVDSHAFMLSLIGEAEANGAIMAFGSTVERIQPRSGGFAISVLGEEAPVLFARKLVNAGGLHASALARAIEGLAHSFVPPTLFAKGNYFSLDGAAPFKRLVYPIPEPGGLGIHATIDLAGRVRFGPDVEWCDAINYSVDEGRSGQFYKAIRAYWPGLADGRLRPDYSGVRPKLSGPGEPAADFVISDASQHGLSGLINLFGLESPGLTAALAVAEEVEARLRD